MARDGINDLMPVEREPVPGYLQYILPTDISACPNDQRTDERDGSLARHFS